jgi:hypothetical protein
MAILKYSYLSLGIILYGFVNFISYTHESYQADLATKIIFSLISFILLMTDYAVILMTKRLFKKEFSEFTTYMKITLYIGIVIAPLISLYY